MHINQIRMAVTFDEINARELLANDSTHRWTIDTCNALVVLLNVYII